MLLIDANHFMCRPIDADLGRVEELDQQIRHGRDERKRVVHVKRLHTIPNRFRAISIIAIAAAERRAKPWLVAA